mmetsp:Transcript_142885/g.398077  ORF Transcript_142885/g.398077 Transcript_142885/m.398077 type:complete len:467 (+) Transcript_142885:186-1586(+)|eukprot:CAMPEP_0179106428 /NCGR_PEP_ID=MMETSP0796-20121207/49486_1 /TAXON_ID=73915 /ORGANISM="Pyrodinium bahamense, Strain pbaha01" /LENGTH=466 /DNA_ID=CAMNT_0020804461 /DNA_START=173 /DNA_END=1573 /DNA_ORIENTATION=+
MFSLFSQRHGEKRRDPEDGQFRTYEELQQLCEGKYSEEEIRDYWEQQCKEEPVEVQDEREQHNVANDPFMTRPTGGEQERGTDTQNAFLTGDFRPLVNVQRDPFMTQPQRASRSRSSQDNVRRPPSQDDVPHSRREEIYEAAKKAKRHWTDVACRLLGPGDLDRRRSVRNMLVLAPWLLFMWVLLVWLLLRHYSGDMCALITAILMATSLSLVALWSRGMRWGSVSLLGLGLLCLLATVSATVVGHIGWVRYWRQYWWLQTGARTERNSAASPAGGQSDTAVIGFWDDKLEQTVGGTYVDSDRSAGYKDEHFYCVAPVLSPVSAEGTLIRVNYWAIGVDCCQLSGSFLCDDSRRYDSGYGIVLLEEGYPCPGCNAEKFASAVRKAESTHGLVSAPGAIFVRWVRSPTVAVLGILWQALLFIALSGLIAFCVIGTLGSAAWYYGFGKRRMYGSLEDFEEGVQKRLLD